MKLNQTVSFLDHIDNFTGKKSFAKNNLCAWFCLFPGFYQCLPDIIFFSLEQKHFNFCLRVFFYTKQSRRNYLGIVNHQAVSRMQIFQYICKMLVFHLTRLTVKHHQTGTGTVFERILCNQFFRKIIIIIFYIHSIHCFSLSTGFPSALILLRFYSLRW